MPLSRSTTRSARLTAAPLSYAAVIERAQRAELNGRRSDARALYEVALLRLAEATDESDASNLLRWIARTHRDDADLDLTLDCAEAALAVAEAHAHRGALRHASSLVAAVRVQQGDLDEAERLYDTAQEGAIEDGELTLVAMTAQNLGVVASIRGDADIALQYYRKSLTGYRTLGMLQDVCVVLNNLGLLLTQLERWDEAAESFDEAMRAAKQLRDRAGQMLVEMHRAEWSVAQGDYAGARSASERARLLGILVKDAPALGALHRVIGVLERECGNFDRAEEHFGMAHDIGTARQDILLLADTARELAELRRRQGRNRDALEGLNRAQCLFLQLRARREIVDICQRTVKLEGDFLEVARRWGTSIECNDEYTQGHCERVASIACALAAADGMSGQSLFWFRIGALLHDVGKLMLPAGVLNKCGKLSADEWAAVRSHPVAGVSMLSEVEFPWDVSPIVKSHHERWDGAGYPDGLAGDAIPRVARMVCIADVYDALTSERSYKQAMTHDAAMAVMRADSGRQFDPDLFALFERVAGLHAEAWTKQALGERDVNDSWQVAAPRSDDETGAVLLTDACRFRLTEDVFGRFTECLAGDAGGEPGSGP